MDDRARVEELIGRPPRGAFDVVVRTGEGDPVVVRNAPFLGDGTPMPTRYYLVGTDLVRAISRIEAVGGVRQSEADLDPADIASAHAAYEAERDTAIPADQVGLDKVSSASTLMWHICSLAATTWSVNGRSLGSAMTVARSTACSRPHLTSMRSHRDSKSHDSE
jgi:hypothetical protein